MPKISELAAAGALAFTNLLAVVQGGATRKATAAQVGAVIGTYLGARSVLASGAAGDGAADDRGSFVTARDAVPTGEAGRVVVPKGTAAYSLSGPAFGPNGRSVDWEFEPGANIAGGILTRINGTAYRFRARPTKAAWAVTKDIPDTTTGQAVHEYVEVENAGPTTGYGRRYGYVSAGFGPGTYDIAEGSVCTWNRVEGNNGGQSLSQWLVAISPQTSGEGNSWGQFVAEWNVANRGADTGFTEKRSSLVNWSGIFQCVADGDLYGRPGTPTNVTFGMMLAAKPIAGGGP
ncbi:MAG: hypothetical protein K2X46_17855, partial [Roseomonas sp.]|nr:hypothetical protein [Roseomonas sp.]